MWPEHPCALVFPAMAEPELAELTESIRTRGLQIRIQLWQDPDGKVWLLDGRNRLRALQRLGITPGDKYIIHWKGDVNQVPGHIIALNCQRRHLEPRQRIELTVAALKAGEQEITVAKIAAAAQLSNVTVYAHADLLPEGTFCPQGSRDGEIAQLLENPEQLPPDPPRKNNHGGGRPRPLERKVALQLGVSTELVKRVRARANGNNGNGGNPAEHLNDDDRVLQHVAHELQGLCGADLSDAGAHILKQCELSLSRIRMEFATGEAITTVGDMPRIGAYA
jgi:hypothetical protein